MKNKITYYCSLFIIPFVINGCASTPNIIPQINLPSIINPIGSSGRDIADANALFVAGKKREAASAYFAASNNYRSPQSERLMLQAAEITSILRDRNLTQRYLAPISSMTAFNRLNIENKSRFRLVQGQLALNDRNYQESLRILPQQTKGLPAGLSKKILNARINAAQSSGNKLTLVQELIAQEHTLKNDYEVKLNHDRIWGHVSQMPTQRIREGKAYANNRVLREWLNLGSLARASRSNAKKEAAYKEGIRGWMAYNPKHPGIVVAKKLLTKPKTVITPYLGSVKPAK